MITTAVGTRNDRFPEFLGSLVGVPSQRQDIPFPRQCYDKPSRTSARRYPGISHWHQFARSRDRSRSSDAARSGGSAEIDWHLSHVRASEPWRAGARYAGGAGGLRSTQPNRRFSWLDRDDRWRVRHVRLLAAAGHLRTGLPERPGRDYCGQGGGRSWWLAGQGTLAVRQRLPACRLDVRALRYDRGREAAPWIGRRGGATAG